MGIYRGAGGTGDATTDIEVSILAALSVSAQTAANQASTSASNATTQASNASTSATSAATSASSASTSAGIATTQASTASASATSANTSATNAANSATLAASFTPSQTGNAGKFLTTNGTATNWNSTPLAITNGGTNATTAAAALVSLGVQTSATGSEIVSSGTTGQRDGSPAAGYFRFNTTNVQFEGYNGTAWAGVGGASGGGGNPIMYENDSVVSVNYTMTAGKNASSTGPLTINSGIAVTVPSGSTWVIL